MSDVALDPTSDQEAIYSQVGTVAGSTDVFESIDDGVQLGVINGVPAPYYAVSFGTPFAAAQGRSIAPSEAAQPTVQRVIVTAVASTKASSRALSNAMLALTGYKPSSNTSELRLVGGGGFPITSTQGRPTMYATETFWVWTGNQDPTLS